MNLRRAIPTLLAGALAGTACTRRAPVLFVDVTGNSGIQFQLSSGPSGERLVPETMVGGLAWIDYDADGDSDLYLVNAHAAAVNAGEPGQEEDRLYRNDGAGHFTDVTRAAGVGDPRYGMGVAVGDMDQDGDQDLLVTNVGRNTLYQNQGDGTFADVTSPAGLNERGFNSSAAWFDMDRDGDLDLYVVRYLKYDPRTARRCHENGLPVSCHPRLFAGESDLLYRNLGGARFEEIGERAGIDRGGEGEGKGLGLFVFDHDRDGHLDVFVANDGTPNYLWRNRGDGTFIDVAPAAGVAFGGEGKALAGMGVDAGDVNGDGFTDIHVTNFSQELNSLFLGAVGGQFREASLRSGLGATFQPLGFGTLLLDVDLDGDTDIVTANGHINEIIATTDPGMGSSYEQAPDLFLNRGDGHFEKAGALAGPFFSERVVGRGLASADFDGDGDVDVAVVTRDRGLILLRNENPLRHRSVTVRLSPRKGSGNPFGARLEAVVGGQTRAFEYTSARSYLSACEPHLVIGLGDAPALEKLTVYWPSGRTTELREVKPQRVEISEP